LVAGGGGFWKQGRVTRSKTALAGRLRCKDWNKKNDTKHFMNTRYHFTDAFVCRLSAASYILWTASMRAEGGDPMADPDQLALLKKSVEEWNAWRKANPLVKVDLSGTDLSGTDLSGANLSTTVALVGEHGELKAPRKLNQRKKKRRV
jgi:Pentapeptide repeats (8 copies)